MIYGRFLALRSRLSLADKGASMVEYALLVILIAILAFVAVQVFGDTLSGTYSEISSEVVKARES